MIRITPTTYEQDGLSYDRITEIISHTWPMPELQDWRASVGKARANRDLKHAQHIGTVVDKSITALWAGLKPPLNLSVEVRQALRGFKEWKALNADLTPVAMQVPILDGLRVVGGTPDFLTASEGIDWKTSARFSFTSVLQIDQYWRLAELMGYSLRQYRLVRFDKILGTWEERILHPEGIDWSSQWLTRDFLGNTFTHLLGIYRAWQFTMGQERVLSLPSDATA